MNLSHIIHEFSFGPYFPAIAQPLDMTYTITESRESPSSGKSPLVRALIHDLQSV
jgi:hypothetical protein